MLTVEYASYGYCASDFQILEWVEQKIEEYFLLKAIGQEDSTITIGTSEMIDAFRMMVIEGKISHEEIQFEFNDKVIALNEFGNPATWPKGFGDAHQHILYRILKGQTAMRKGKKKHD